MQQIIPPEVVYAGLAGVLIALVVATATNGWSLRVFLLLVLRLAIGWHFLFEGLHKIHSEYVGPTDTNRVFTSEPYFLAAEGPVGEELRKRYIGDPDAKNAARLSKVEDISAAEFERRSTEEQAKLCPAPVAELLTKFANDARPKAEEALAKAKAEYEAAKAAADEQAKVPVPTDPTAAAEAIKKTAAAKAEADAKKLAVDVAARRVELASNDGLLLKAAFAAWVYGATDRPTKVEFFNNDDVPLSAAERLAHIEWLKQEYDEYKGRMNQDLGQGTGTEQKRGQKLRSDLTAAKTGLVNDTDAFIDELRQAVGADAPTAEPKPIKTIDRLTRWGITIIGAGLLLGLFTRVWCVAGAGFLVMTYLSHPTVPWLPMPPMTEGNPLFINKNLIEALALLAVASFPTGRWLGLDALLYYVWGRCCGRPRS